MLSQQLFNGLVVGATYAIFALGFTVMFGVLGVVNLTYGFYFSFGALVALWLTQALNLPVWASFILAVIASGVVAAVVDWLLLTRLRRARARTRVADGDAGRDAAAVFAVEFIARRRDQALSRGRHQFVGV